jgi:hypothetical protein
LKHFCEQISTNITYITLKMMLSGNIPQSASLEWGRRSSISLLGKVEVYAMNRERTCKTIATQI